MNCKPFVHCFDFINQKHAIVVFSDRRSATTFIYENRNSDSLSKYRIDGCLITDNGAKCDYLLLNCNKSISYFIELKGSDLIRAVDQIDRSIDLLIDSLTDFTVFARIVLTRVNTTDLKSAKYLRLEKRIQGLGGNLKKQCRQMTEMN